MHKSLIVTPALIAYAEKNRGLHIDSTGLLSFPFPMGYRNPVVRGIGVLELLVPFLLFPNLKPKLSANIPEMVHLLPFLIGCRCRVGVRCGRSTENIATRFGHRVGSRKVSGSMRLTASWQLLFCFPYYCPLLLYKASEKAAVFVLSLNSSRKGETPWEKQKTIIYKSSSFDEFSSEQIQEQP